MAKNLRRNKILWKPVNNQLETIITASNNRLTGKVVTSRQEYSTDYIMRQLQFGFLKLLPSQPGPVVLPHVGTVVKCRKSTNFASRGDLGVCCRIFSVGGKLGADFIFENRFYDRFTAEMSSDLLLEIGFCESLRNYEGSSVQKLELDYIQGVFDVVFKEKKFLNFYGDRN